MSEHEDDGVRMSYREVRVYQVLESELTVLCWLNPLAWLIVRNIKKKNRFDEAERGGA